MKTYRIAMVGVVAHSRIVEVEAINEKVALARAERHARETGFQGWDTYYKYIDQIAWEEITPVIDVTDETEEWTTHIEPMDV